MLQCPNCGWKFDPKLKPDQGKRTPPHAVQPNGQTICRGSGQSPKAVNNQSQGELKP